MSDGFVVLPDGRRFPSYEGEALAWNFSVYLTQNEAADGYPRARRVLWALAEERPERLEREYHDAIRDSQGRVFRTSIPLQLIREVWPEWKKL